MLNLPTIAELEAAISSASCPELKGLLADRLADTIKCQLESLTHVLVVEAGDSEADFIEAIGFSPLVSRINGLRDQPDWDWMERHNRWWELLYTVGNDGFAYIILVKDDPGSPLVNLCRRGGEG